MFLQFYFRVKFGNLSPMFSLFIFVYWLFWDLETANSFGFWFYLQGLCLIDLWKWRFYSFQLSVIDSWRYEKFVFLILLFVYGLLKMVRLLKSDSFVFCFWCTWKLVLYRPKNFLLFSVWVLLICMFNFRFQFGAVICAGFQLFNFFWDYEFADRWGFHIFLD